MEETRTNRLLSVDVHQAQEKYSDSWCLVYKPLCITAPVKRGLWKLELWMPEKKQGFLKTVSGPLSKLTGEGLRKVEAQVLVGNDCVGSVKVVDTKLRYNLEFRVPDGEEVVQVRFVTKAVAVPVHFSYSLVCVEDECCPEQDIDWLEAKFTRIPIEDKVMYAERIHKCGEEGWPEMQGSCAISFDHSLGVLEMRRSSVYKEKAASLGLLRPFLLLVSMHPGRRIGWALNLDISLCKDGFGDSHFEAYEILTHSRKGVMARVMKTFRENMNPFKKGLNWYTILYRVLYLATSTKDPTVLARLTQMEKRNPELSKVLKGLKEEKEQELCCSRLENAFAALFFGVNAMSQLETQNDGGVQDSSQMDLMASTRTAAVQIVQADPEMREKSQLLLKHNFEDPELRAVAVLNAYRKNAAGATCEGYNKVWGTQAHEYNQEFMEEIQKKVAKEKCFVDRSAVVGTVVPLILASTAVTPAVVALVLMSRTAIKRTFPNLPCSVAAILTGLITQRYWLAISDISLDDPSFAN